MEESPIWDLLYGAKIEGVVSKGRHHVGEHPNLTMNLSVKERKPDVKGKQRRIGVPTSPNSPDQAVRVTGQLPSTPVVLIEDEGDTNKELAAQEVMVREDKQTQHEGPGSQQVVKSFGCSLCGERFVEFNGRHIHYITDHTTSFLDQSGIKSKTYPCALCEEVFQTTGARRIHYLHYHTSSFLDRAGIKIKTYSCALCDEAFQTTRERRTHYLGRHVSEPGPGTQEFGTEVPSPRPGNDDTGSSLPMNPQVQESPQQDSSFPADDDGSSLHPRAKNLQQELFGRLDRQYSCEKPTCEKRFGTAAEMNYHLVSSHNHLEMMELGYVVTPNNGDHDSLALWGSFKAEHRIAQL